VRIEIFISQEFLIFGIWVLDFIWIKDVILSFTGFWKQYFDENSESDTHPFFPPSPSYL
jgi:hypothetical protein